MKIILSFWGVRGSIATHDSAGSHFGGNTACVAIHYNRRWLICDAGTGIRPLGLKLKKTKEPIALFLSHLHWDHIFGLPFFKPLYQRRREIFLAGPSNGHPSFKKVLDKVIMPPFFPIRTDRWGADIGWHTLKNERIKWGGCWIEARKVRHPGETYGFQFLFPGSKRIVYVTDHELTSSNKKFVSWIQNADILIHDSQYDRKKYRQRKNWGHSAFETVLETAIRANVKKLVLFHHDPESSDALLKKRLRTCQKYIRSRKAKIVCRMAKEGLSLTL